MAYNPLNPNGQATMANSAPVVLASDQSTLPISAASLPLPSGASTSAKQDTQITAEQAIQTSVELIDDAIKTDDAAFTPGATKVMMAGFEYDDTGTDSIDEGDAGAARMSANRNQYMQIRDAAGNERGVNVTAGGAMTTDGSATTQPISAASLPLPTGASTLAEQQTQTASLSVMDDWDNAASDGASVSGDVAHDAVDAGEPVKVGGKALTAQPTAVAANDRVNAMFDIYGRQIVSSSLREMKGNQITTITASTSETTCVTADATYKLDVYAVFVTNTSATATEVSFKDSTAGTTRFQLSVPANDMRGFCLPIDAGHVQAAANNNWTATCADSVSSIVITVLFTKNL